LLSFKIKFKIGMRTKVAVSSVIDGGRKLVEVEVEVEETFKTDVVVLIGNIMCLTSHWPTIFSRVISLILSI